MFLGATVVVILSLLRRNRTAVAIAATALLLPIFLTFGPDDLWQLDAGVSARPAAQGAIDHLPAAELGTATTYKVQRGLKFGLNFYLHRELAEWVPPVGRSSIVFTSHMYTKELEQMGVRCSRSIAFPAVEICVDSSTIAGSAAVLADGRQPH